jgi:hypothetical protein
MINQPDTKRNYIILVYLNVVLLRAILYNIIATQKMGTVSEIKCWIYAAYEVIHYSSIVGG